MIRNLNQVTFQGFGNVLSERGQTNKSIDRDSSMLVQLSPTEAVFCRANADTRVACAKGMSVLSVSHDGRVFHHFYLDKSVLLNKGIYFTVNPFQGEASVYFSAQEEPEIIERKPAISMRVDNQYSVGGIYTFFYQEKEQGFLFPGESHPMPELTYVDQGSLHSVVDGQDTLLQQGELVVYGSGQWHMQYADIGVAPRFVTITFDFPSQVLTPLLNRKISAPQHTVTLLQKMFRELERTDPYSKGIVIAELELLLLMLLRDVDAPTNNKLQTSNAIHSENEIIRQAQQFISSHIREKLSVTLVARQVDVSPSYLTALFHKNLQISPGEYIRRIKLQESKQMIRENNLNFTEIAAALQYSTVHHFSRQFKEKFGITPTEYAKSVR